MANSIYYLGSTLGLAVGFLVGGLAVKAIDVSEAYLAVGSLESWRLALFLVTVPSPFFLILVLSIRLPRPVQSQTNESLPLQNSMSDYLRNHGGTLTLILAMVAIFSMAFSGLLIWVPVSMSRTFGISPAENGTYMAACIALGSSGGAVIASLLTKHFLERLGSRAPLRVSWIAMIMIAPSSILLPFVTAAWQAYLIVACQMFVGTMFGSLTPGIMQDITPPPVRARVFSIYTMVITIVGGIGIYFVGLFSSLFQDQNNQLLVALAIIGTPAWILSAACAYFGERQVPKTIKRLNSEQDLTISSPDEDGSPTKAKKFASESKT